MSVMDCQRSKQKLTLPVHIIVIMFHLSCLLFICEEILVHTFLFTNDGFSPDFCRKCIFRQMNWLCLWGQKVKVHSPSMTKYANTNHRAQWHTEVDTG